MSRVNDIVPPDATEDELRIIYGDNADAVIAFKRFLALPQEDDAEGRRVFLTPPHWMAYAKNEITSAEALRLDDEWKKTHP